MAAITVPNALTDATTAAGALMRQSYIVLSRLTALSAPGRPAPTALELERIDDRLNMVQEMLDECTTALAWYSQAPEDDIVSCVADQNATLGR